MEEMRLIRIRRKRLGWDCGNFFGGGAGRWGRGFGLIAVDLSDIAPRLVRHVPLDSWFRFRRAVEDTPTILMLLEQESNAKSCASLGLRLEAGAVGWSGRPVGGGAAC